MAERTAQVRALGAVAAVLLVAGCSAGPSPAPTSGASQVVSGPTTGPATTPPSAAPTAAPSPAGTQVPAGWHTAPIQPWFATVQFTDVVWTGTRFIATVSGPGDGGTFADSADGVTWHLQTPGAADWRPEHLASGPSGVEAVGEIGDALASWSSPDGLSWTPKAKAFPLPSLGGDTVYVGDVAGNLDGWLAVGRREAACTIDCGSDPVRAYSWTSSDGLSWTRAPDDDSLKAAGMSAVTPLDTGFVAVGVASAHPVIWVTPDRETWVRADDAPALHEPTQKGGALPAAATGVAIVGPNNIAVVGSAYAQDSCAPGVAAKLCPGVRAWLVSTGPTFTKASLELPIDGQIFSVVATRTGLLAVGPSGACTGGIWSSANGLTWTCDAKAPAFTGFGPYAAAVSPTVEVAVGLTSAGWDESGDLGEPGSIWVRTLP